MRKLVYELLNPTIKRAQKDREEINESKKLIAGHANKLEEIEISLFKSDQKRTIFDEIYSKISDNETARRFENSQMMSEQKLL